MGRGSGNFISYGSLPLPTDTKVRGRDQGNRLVPAGFARGVEVCEFAQDRVSEHVAHSWFVDYEGGRHPFDGETRPYATGWEGEKYSWAKAPRYEQLPAETGPLAEKVVSGNPLFTDLVCRDGPSVFTRQLARIIRQAELIPTMEVWFSETTGGGRFYESPGEITEGEAFGLIDASRGALGHWVKIADGKIEHYQIITPTAWNASPRDSDGTRGPWEEALVGTEIKDLSDPVELGHVVRSFDACLVCTVHALSQKAALSRKTYGF
jgi:hydrogenase large subunit